ncbi:uncharacterized protein A1O9_06960 [Exophiala aquamarina CBS 119918]|uniref:Uncharacterized protein n=1 Tax=Exophiala aquamarina CBS 119918 TaxID=1182545 RepID=A0A072PMQ2_9EURO|nr:uncharacterized protein A1O9_06960 [Exophiala aquamarina CBS 119918]KEF56770.1 hypothetical protein A1O9_06960 [Exophiala aquamarina CBS 119918]
MSDPVLAEHQTLLPPPAPPLPPPRLVQLQKIIAPWGPHTGADYYHGGPAQSDHDHVAGRITNTHTYSTFTSSQNTSHRTGIPIAALDINSSGTHAVLAGKEILKTIRVEDGTVTDAFNIRTAVASSASSQTSPQLDGPGKRRDFLPARDVKWSTGNYKHIIATAATSGRISLYDLNVGGASKLELAWLHEHTNQINKLDFDPFAGYLLLSASQDKSVRLWDLRDGKRDRSRLRFEPRIPVRDVRWSPSEPLDFAICTDSGVIQKWDARSPLGPKLSINGHEKACYSLDWHPDGRHVTSGGFDKYIRVWDFQNDNKRQKPVFQLRAPSGIRNIRWRPPCRASETTDSGHWQSTQIAVSYTHDDPRIHTWDLRRPWLPFRELDRYNSAANDLLWATKDKLWTVGDEGVFTQWDLKHGAPFYNEISPCTSTFTPDGEYYMFSERRELPRTSAAEDPALGFLSIPRDKLSSGDDPTASRSFTDDENPLDSHLSSTHGRIERGLRSSKSTKSQANSPLSLEEKPPILSLDRAVFQRPDLFNNDQFGTANCVPGIATELGIVQYLASNYASPATAEERVQSPSTILERLEAAFYQNAVACDAVSLHRMAQSWRILGAVFVPELRDWADANRSQRRAEAGKRREMLEQFRAGSHRSILSPLPGLTGRGSKAKGDAKSHRLMSSLLKSTVESDRPFHSDSTSNATTPLVKPFRNSPYSSRRGWSKWALEEEEIDEVLTLPPSVLSSHSTAAAAARALVDSPGRGTGSAPSSPDVNRQSATTTSKDHNSPNPSPKPSAGVRDAGTSSPARGISATGTTQDDRRAALRDYRVQARPIFTLEGSSNTPALHPRHDSDDSFQMFSASGDSSQRARSLGQSFDSAGGNAKSHHQRAETPNHSEQDDETEEERDLSFGEPHVENIKGHARSFIKPSQISGSVAVETPPDMSFGSDAPTGARIQVSAQNDPGAWDAGQEAHSMPTSEFHTAMSSTPDIFHFEGTSLDKPRIYTSNPLRVSEAHEIGDEKSSGHQPGLSNSMSMDELDCETYLISDFRPIDLFNYEPKSPFAWSSLPLICQSIAFDVENGIGHSQFASHLLMHVHPYFFDARFRKLKGVEPGGTNNLADRLMTPHLGHRIIESIFDAHLSFLRQMQLVASAAVLRKMCVEFEYPRLYISAGGDKQAGSSLTDGDAASLSIVCTTCHGQMPSGRNTCERCQRVRSVCPICLSMHTVDQEVPNASETRDAAGSVWPWGSHGRMWTFCQACGHSGHVRCMKEWFAEPSSNGTCPTQGCGCDCGPGKTREARIEQQIKQEEEVRLIRGLNGNHGGGGSTKRDSLRAGGSPAVDKARAALRKSITGDRATQSGDERSLAGKRLSGASRAQMSGFSGSRKSVRLVTPGEESGGGQDQSSSRS